MNSEVMNQIKQIVDAKAQQQPTPMEFELAYQARVAMDRIRFAIRHTEQFAPHTDQMQETGLQLLDALQRLETVERRFQEHSRIAAEPRSPERLHANPASNGHGSRVSNEPTDHI